MQFRSHTRHGLPAYDYKQVQRAFSDRQPTALEWRHYTQFGDCLLVLMPNPSSDLLIARGHGDGKTSYEVFVAGEILKDPGRDRDPHVMKMVGDELESRIGELERDMPARDADGIDNFSRGGLECKQIASLLQNVSQHGCNQGHVLQYRHRQGLGQQAAQQNYLN